MDLAAMAAASIQQRRAMNAVAQPCRSGGALRLQAPPAGLPPNEKQALSLLAALEQSLSAPPGLLASAPARKPAPADELPSSLMPAYIHLGRSCDAGARPVTVAAPPGFDLLPPSSALGLRQDVGVPAAAPAVHVPPPPGLEDLLPAPGGAAWRQELPDFACISSKHVAQDAITATRAAAAAQRAAVAAKPGRLTSNAQRGTGKSAAPRSGKLQAPASVTAAAAVAPEPKPMRPLQNGETTVVVQNLSGRYGQEDVLRTWPADGGYDFVHLPYNLLQRRALGYVFINFATHERAALFQQRWHGAMLPDGSNKRPLEVGAAEVQGRQANLEIIKTRKITQLEKAGYLPMLFEGAERMDAKDVVAHLERLRGMKGTVPILNTGMLEAAKASPSTCEDAGPATPTTTSGSESCHSPLMMQPWFE